LVGADQAVIKKRYGDPKTSRIGPKGPSPAVTVKESRQTVGKKR